MYDFCRILRCVCTSANTTDLERLRGVVMREGQLQIPMSEITGVEKTHKSMVGLSISSGLDIETKLGGVSLCQLIVLSESDPDITYILPTEIFIPFRRQSKRGRPVFLSFSEGQLYSLSYLPLSICNCGNTRRRHSIR
jgi:hypothetical protein